MADQIAKTNQSKPKISPRRALRFVFTVIGVWLQLSILAAIFSRILGIEAYLSLILVVNVALAVGFSWIKFQRRSKQRKTVPLPPSNKPKIATHSIHIEGLQLYTKTLSPRQFEHWVADRLTDIGWDQVKVSGGKADRGVDIRGVYDGKRCIVQCKHYPDRLVPPNEVRALVGTRTIQRAQRAYLITSGKFGYQCFAEVNGKPVELWDIETLAIHLSNAGVAK